MDIFEAKRTVFTAQSRHLFYCRNLICKYVLEQDAIPVNPFTLWGYFLDDLVDRDLVRRGNNNMLRITDELWVFGPIADGVLIEIEYAMQLRKPIRFFNAGPKPEDITPVEVDNLVFETEALVGKNEEETKQQIRRYLAAFVREPA